ncbi:MAG: DUF4116 domain-containing protein, partial [Gammaproteobacteria bacterium]|nr:DUF4116 domain-containing protein [Gammaproteobacteria bacterium]
EIVLAAVSGDGRALEFVSKALQSDKEVVLTAVKQNGIAIKYASRELQEDMEIKEIASSINAEKNEERSIWNEALIENDFAPIPLDEYK